jgi:hypothetical protein
MCLGYLWRLVRDELRYISRHLRYRVISSHEQSEKGNRGGEATFDVIHELGACVEYLMRVLGGDDVGVDGDVGARE